MNDAPWRDPPGAAHEAFKRLSDDFQRTGAWLHLGDYSARHLRGPRGVTWWTEREIARDRVVSTAHQIGLPNDFIYPHTVILRGEAGNLNLIPFKVPTVLDGFTFEIFCPTDETSVTPGHGVSINLESPTVLGPGWPEFVLGPVPADVIELQPVEVSDDDKRALPVWRAEPLWRLLEAYYRAL